MSSLSPCRFAYSALASILSFLDLKQSQKPPQMNLPDSTTINGTPTTVCKLFHPKQQVDNAHGCTSLIKPASQVLVQKVWQFRRYDMLRNWSHAVNWTFFLKTEIHLFEFDTNLSLERYQLGLRPGGGGGGGGGGGSAGVRWGNHN